MVRRHMSKISVDLYPDACDACHMSTGQEAPAMTVPRVSNRKMQLILQDVQLNITCIFLHVKKRKEKEKKERSKSDDLQPNSDGLQPRYNVLILQDIQPNITLAPRFRSHVLVVKSS